MELEDYADLRTDEQAEKGSKIWAQIMIDQNVAAFLAKQEQNDGDPSETEPEKVSETSQDSDQSQDNPAHSTDISSVVKEYTKTPKICKIMKKMTNTKSPKQCTICGKTYTQAYYCQTHMLSHSENNPLTCVVCGRQFTSKGNLARHLLIHSDAKPFTCDLCGQAFRQRSTLAQHRLVHTAIKENICKICGKRYRDGKGLQKHLLLHEKRGPIECDICGKHFSKEWNCQKHMATHKRAGEDSSFQCMFCGKYYQRKGVLTNHMKKVHDFDENSIEPVTMVAEADDLTLKYLQGAMTTEFESLEDSPVSSSTETT